MKAANFSAPDAIAEPRKQAVRSELARILDSPAFRGSRRCCRFLEYSVEHVLRGCAHEELKERNIGVEVLQRPPDYDTNEDAIVRVTANEVRKRLAQYYQAADPNGDPAIALPPGSYAVAFQWRTPQAEPVEVPPQPRPARGMHWAIGIAAVLLVLAAGFGVVVWRARTLAPAHSATAARSKPDALWSRIFNPGQKTNIVISDAVFREVQQFVGRDISLSDYLAPDYPRSLIAEAKPDLRQVVSFLSRQQTTSVGSATLGAKLLAFGIRFGGDPVIRYPRHINAREFNTDNFILLGSRLSIPWVEMFESSLNFPLATDATTHRFYLRNRAPRGGEPAEYRETESHEETYADIALLPNLTRTGTVLILNGIDMVAAEAAGDFAMGGSLSATLAGATADAKGSGFVEILIRVRAIGGTAAHCEVAAIRPVDPRTPGR